MKVRINTTIDVDISLEEVKRIAKEYLSTVFNVLPDAKINDKGELVFYWEQPAGVHSIAQEKFIRVATENDILYFKFIEALQKLEMEHKI